MKTLSEFIRHRNDLMHFKTGDRGVRALVGEWEPRLEEVLAKVSVLVPIEIAEVNFSDSDDLYEYRVKRWTGIETTIETTRLSSHRRMKVGSLHLWDASSDQVVPLAPLVIGSTCDECGARELFVIDQLDRVAAWSSYDNPATGHKLKNPDHSAHRGTLERLAAIPAENA